MGSCCFYKEFLKELDYIQHEMTVWGHNFDFLQPVWSLKNHVKEFFPMNEVPQEIHQQLFILEERMKVAQQTAWNVCERLKIEVEAMRQKEYPNG